jgi:hypothetical protein
MTYQVTSTGTTNSHWSGLYKDLQGNIAQVAIGMEPRVKDIIFTRLPDLRT